MIRKSVYQSLVIFGMLFLTLLEASPYAVCEVERTDVRKAKEAIEAILLKEPTHVVCMLQLANIHLKQGDIPQGFDLLVDAYAIDPYTVQSSKVAAVLPFALKVTSLKKQAKATNDIRLWNELGDGYRELGLVNEAIAMYKNSLLVEGAQEEIRIRLALLLEQTQKLYSAVEELKTILENNKDHFYANYYLGKILLKELQLPDEARIYLEKAKALMPKESMSSEMYVTLMYELETLLQG